MTACCLHNALFRYVLSAALLLVDIAGTAQYKLSPGGVGSVMHWYAADTAKDGLVLKSLHTVGDTVFPIDNPARPVLFNGHTSLAFSNNSKVIIPLGLNNPGRLTVFTVYQSLDTSMESQVWSIATQGGLPASTHAQLVLTTRRVADLAHTQYLNYIDLLPANPKINTYVQQRVTDMTDTVAHDWLLGQLPSSPRMPVRSFRGLIPEMVSFDRVLSHTERLRVATYLAIKYGVTLTDPDARYIGSNGQILWDGNSYPSYHHNIAGIGRDDSSGLYQSASCSGNIPGLLSIGAKDSLRQTCFLLWGDNAESLGPATKIQGLPLVLKRRWLVVATNDSANTSFDCWLDTRKIDMPLPANPVFWLVADTSGSLQFDQQHAVFVPMQTLSQQGQAHFSGLVWRHPNTEFSFIAGPPFLVTMRVDSPGCHPNQTGRLFLQVHGGTAPYKMIVQKDGRAWMTRDLPAYSDSMTGLTPGRYNLHVVDAVGDVYMDSLLISDSDAPIPFGLADSYHLGADSTLVLDASIGMPPGTSYHWSGPNTEASTAVLSIHRPGSYTLQCTFDGCQSSRGISVVADPVNAIHSMTVFPVPSSGDFNVAVELTQPGDVQMELYDAAGRLLQMQKGGGQANYRFDGSIRVAGTYSVTIRSNGSAGSKMIVITR